MPASRSPARLPRWLGLVLALAAAVAFAVFVHWFITAGHARRARLDAEYHALQDIRTIYHAQREYYVQNPFLGFPCSLNVLGGIPPQGAPPSSATSTAAQLLDNRLASGHADGYVFALSECTRLENVGFHGYTNYHLTAVPDSNAPPGTAGFCVDDDVEKLVPGEVAFERPDIRMDPAGGSHCIEPAPEP